MKIKLTEKKLNQIVTESVKKVLSEKWQDEYYAAMDKRDYEDAKSQYDSKKWYQKIAAMLTGKTPKDPNPQKTLQELLNGYVDAFNKEHGIGKRNDYDNGESFHSRMYYQNDNKQPVLTATYSNNGTNVQQSRKAYDNNGEESEWGIEYPYSEIGATQDSAPSRSNNEVKQRYQDFGKHRSEISQAIKNRPKKK